MNNIHEASKCQTKQYKNIRLYGFSGNWIKSKSVPEFSRINDEEYQNVSKFSRQQIVFSLEDLTISNPINFKSYLQKVHEIDQHPKLICVPSDNLSGARQSSVKVGFLEFHNEKFNTNKFLKASNVGLRPTPSKIISTSHLRPRFGKEYRPMKEAHTNCTPTNISNKTLHSSKPNNKKVPSSIFYCQFDNSSEYQKQIEKPEKYYFSENFESERKIAYAKLSRAADGTSVVLEECLREEKKDENHDYFHNIISSPFVACSVLDQFRTSSDVCEYIPLASNDLHAENLSINYADIDFNSLTEDSALGPISSMSLKTEYACIDFDKTFAVSKTGRDLIKERQATVFNMPKPTYDLDLKNTPPTPSLKKTSSFYVSVPKEYLNYVMTTDNPLRQTVGFSEPKKTSIINASPKKSRRPTRNQRKFSLEFLDSPKSSASRHSNTLPHSKNKAA